MEEEEKTNFITFKLKNKTVSYRLLLSRRFGSNALFHFYYPIHCSIKYEKKNFFTCQKHTCVANIKLFYTKCCAKSFHHTTTKNGNNNEKTRKMYNL